MKRSSETPSDTQGPGLPTKKACPEANIGSWKSFKFTGTVVSVLVGTRVFSIHHDQLVKSSEFFKNALKVEWRSSLHTDPINLSDKDPAYFEKYFEWLYGLNPSPFVSGEAGEAGDKWKDLASLYVLGEEMMDTEFQKVVITHMMAHEWTWGLPNLESVKIIYDGTTPSSPARRLIVDVFAFKINFRCSSATDLATNPEHKDFLGDLFLALLKYREKVTNGSTEPWVNNREFYGVGSGGKTQENQGTPTQLGGSSSPFKICKASVAAQCSIGTNNSPAPAFGGPSAGSWNGMGSMGGRGGRGQAQHSGSRSNHTKHG